jgi:hypothetical protein
MTPTPEDNLIVERLAANRLSIWILLQRAPKYIIGSYE